MTIKSVVIFAISAFSFFAGPACNAQPTLIDSCKTVITDGLNEYSIKNDSSSYLNSVHDNYCEASGSAKTDKFGLGIEAVVKAIPIKFTGTYDSGQTAMKNFCKNYASTTAQNSAAASYQQTIVRRAYESFDTCVSLAAQGTSVKHFIRSPDTFDFYLAPGFSRPVKINGMHVPKNVVCKGILPGETKSSVINEDTVTTLNNNDSMSVGCTRTGDKDSDGNITLQEAVVTIFTNLQNGNYSVFLPKNVAISSNWGTDFESRLNQVKDELMQSSLKSKSEIELIKTNLKTNGTIVMDANLNTRSGICPAGSFAVGTTFRIDGGGPHGIVSNVQPVCRSIP